MVPGIIGAMIMTISAILVEDEKIIMDMMEGLLEPYNDFITIIDKAYSCKDAIDKINRKKPDVIFLDIQLPDGDGFFILKSLAYKPFVIFVTGYNQYALQAFENYSLDYILKPVARDRLDFTIGKLKKIFSDNESSQEIVNQFNTNLLNFLNTEIIKIPIKTADGYDFVKMDEILYVKAEDKYTRIYTNFDNYLSDYSLKQLGAKFQTKFIKIHRNTLVNKSKIISLKKWFKGRYKIILEDHSEHDISFRQLDEVKNAIINI